MGDQRSWRPTSAPTARRYDDIWFVTPDIGWAINSNGAILKTIDGGASWQQQFHVTSNSGGDVWLRCLGFASESRGWVGTTSGSRRLFETVDGGANWTPVTNLPANAPAAICGMSVVSDLVVYAAGTNYPFPYNRNPPRMMKTVDGGASWTAWEMTDHAALLVDTFFVTPERGFVVGGKVHEVAEGDRQCAANEERANIRPVVLRTEDGGKTWTNQLADTESEFPLGEWGWKIFFLTEQIGFVSLENFCEGAILKTVDGGLTWERIPINDAQNNGNLEGIGFVSENLGWVGGWGSIDMTKGTSSQTEDGGKNWTDADWGTADFGEFLNRFRFIGDVGYASGDTVYKYSTEPVLPTGGDALPALIEQGLIEGVRPIRFGVTIPAESSTFSIDIWDRFAGHVRSLRHQDVPSGGEQSVEWDLVDDSGVSRPPGYYVVRVTTDDRAESAILRVTD